MILTRAQIKAAEDLRAEIVDVPEWGGEVRIRTLSFAAANSMFKEEVKDFDPRLRLIAACMVDDDGAQIFSEQDLGELGSRNAEVIARIWKKCVEINGMTLKSDATESPKSTGDGAEESSNG